MTEPTPSATPSPSPPPPVPAPPPPPAPKRRSWLVIVLIVAAVLGIPCIAGVIGAVAVVVPRMKEKQGQLACHQNLSQLGMLRLDRGDGARPAHSGPALFLSWCQDGTIPDGGEWLLLCPDDPEADRGAAPAAWDAADLSNPPRGLCSYAVRDFAAFPLEAHADEVQAIAACLHHRGGVVVLYDDGSTQFHQLLELGLVADTDVSVGPESKAELLRPLKFYR